VRENEPQSGEREMKKPLAWLLMGLLVIAVACDSELDGQTAAQVSPPTPDGPETEADEIEEPVELRELAFNQETSKIEWLASKVSLDHDGGFHGWEGMAQVDADNQVKAVEFTVDTTSIWSDNDRLTGHLKSEDFFEVETYPEATFVSRSISEGVEIEGAEGTHTVTGDMTIKETTQRITFPVTVVVEEDVMKITSNFTLMRFDFGMEYPGAADDLIRDEVLLKLHFELPLQVAAVADVEGDEEADEG
jgi:polyisoprenoid-binding protein YceI